MTVQQWQWLLMIKISVGRLHSLNKTVTGNIRQVLKRARFGPKTGLPKGSNISHLVTKQGLYVQSLSQPLSSSEMFTDCSCCFNSLSFCPKPVGSFRFAFGTPYQGWTLSTRTLQRHKVHAFPAQLEVCCWKPLGGTGETVCSNLHKTQQRIPSYSSSSSSSSGMIMFIRHNTSVAWPAPWFRFNPGTCSCTGACCNTPTHTDCNFLPLNTPQLITATQPSAQNRYKYAHIAHTQKFR